jgi:hypothetical protein
MVAAPAVVADEPRVHLVLELADAREPPSAERGAPALLERGAVEPLAGGVAVRTAWRDAMVVEAAGGELGLAAPRDPPGPLSMSTAARRHRGAGNRRATWLAKRAAPSPVGVPSTNNTTAHRIACRRR